MSELLSNLLDEALQRLKAGESVDAILADYPAHRDELGLLLAVAQELSTLKDVPPPLRSDAGLATFLAKAEDLQVKAHSSSRTTRRLVHRIAIAREWWHRPRTRLAWGMGVTIVLLFAVIGVTFQLSSPSLPGDWLYPAKLAGEELHLFFARDQVARAEYELARAGNRVSEIRELAETGRSIPETTLKRLDRALQESLTSVALVQDGEMRRLLADLEAMASEQTVVLFDLEAKTQEQASQLLGQIRQSLEQTRTFASAGQADVNSFRLTAQLSAFNIGWSWSEPSAGGAVIPAQREEPEASPQSETLPLTSPVATRSPATATHPAPTPTAADGFTSYTSPSTILAHSPTPTEPPPQPTDTVWPSATSRSTGQPSETLEPGAPSQPTETPPALESPATSQGGAEDEPVRTPKPSKTPRPTRTPRPTKTARPTQTPEPTETLAPSGATEPGETPQPSEALPPVDRPDPTKMPKPTKSPKS